MGCRVEICSYLTRIWPQMRYIWWLLFYFFSSKLVFKSPNYVKKTLNVEKTEDFTFSRVWIVFCCYNCLDLPWEKFFQVWVTFFPSSREQEYCVEKRLCKFEAVGREFVTFLRHYSCLRELGKQVTNTWKKLWAWYKSRQL